MSDRLEEIKNWLKLTKTGMFGGIRPSARARTYFTWLLLGLEQSKAENAELQAVFDLQETRTKKAEKMWQQATGKHSTLPDLGVLLDWLMGEVEQCKAINEMFRGDVERLQQTNRRLNRRCTDMEGALKEKLEKGKVEYRSFGKILANAAAGLYKHQAEKAEAEVGRLNALLAYQGIPF